MPILIVLATLITLGLLAGRFGTDSRDGLDWQAAAEVWRTRVDR